MSTETITREQNPDRFEISVDGAVAGFAQFVDDGEQRIFFHTEIGEEFGGQGLAGKVVQQALETTRTDGKRIVPVCPYVAKFVTKSEEFTDLVDQPTPDNLAVVRRSAG